MTQSVDFHCAGHAKCSCIQNQRLCWLDGSKLSITKSKPDGQVLIIQDSEFTHSQQVFMKCAPSTCRLEGTELLCVSTALESNRAQHITCCSTGFAGAVLEPGSLQCFHRRIKEVIHWGYLGRKGFLCEQALSTGREKTEGRNLFFFSAKLHS